MGSFAGDNILEPIYLHEIEFLRILRSAFLKMTRIEKTKSEDP